MKLEGRVRNISSRRSYTSLPGGAAEALVTSQRDPSWEFCADRIWLHGEVGEEEPAFCTSRASEMGNSSGLEFRILSKALSSLGEVASWFSWCPWLRRFVAVGLGKCGLFRVSPMDKAWPE